MHTCVFSNGDLYIYDWSGDTFTLYDLSVGGLTVSTSADINCRTSRGRLVVTDGVNSPCMVTGPMGSVAYTTLGNAPVAHRCGIYYDKVFFWDIPGAENQFGWSDEGDPANGYNGKNQFWEFAQTDAGKILGMAPLNERNIILKQDSATMLMGSADENFQTAAVREGLSETEGTAAGGSVVILKGDVYCLSMNGPRRIRQGQVYESLHDVGVDMLRDLWDNVNRGQLYRALGWTDRQEAHVGWLYAAGSSTDLDSAFVFNTKNQSWSMFKFSGYAFSAVGSVEDTAGTEWVVFGDDAGNVYKYNVDEAKYDDDGTAIELIARSRMVGGEQPHVEKRATETQFQFYLTTDFEGETRPMADYVTLDGKRFGLYDETGKKRYRRGWNHTGFRIGWELYANKTDQTITLSKAVTFASAVGMYGDWNG